VGWRLAQQPLQPQIIQQHLLVGRFPEHTDLLGLISARKGPLLYPHGNELFEVVRFRITTAGLPFRHCTPGDPQQVRQSRLRQAETRAHVSIT
jgi:hypothetical protein